MMNEHPKWVQRLLDARKEGVLILKDEGCSSLEIMVFTLFGSVPHRLKRNLRIQSACLCIMQLKEDFGYWRKQDERVALWLR